MKRALVLVTTLAFAVALSACTKDGKDEANKTDSPAAAKAETPKKEMKQAKSEEAKVGELSVDSLAGLMKDGTSNVAILDSNGPTTREKHGKIPGATLLTDYRSFDKSELPKSKDAKLVFYCSNTQCGASHASAKVAMAEGYDDVHVLPVGIMGWKEAGKDTKAVN